MGRGARRTFASWRRARRRVASCGPRSRRGRTASTARISVKSARACDDRLRRSSRARRAPIRRGRGASTTASTDASVRDVGSLIAVIATYLHACCIRECIHSAAMAGKTRVLLDRPTRRAAILRAAAAAFAERGFADTSMDDVAAAAGITRLIVYRHFDSKEALYAAVLQHVRDRLAEEGARVRGRGRERGRPRPAHGRARRRGRRRRSCCGMPRASRSSRAYADEFREQVIAYAEQLMRDRARAGAGAQPVGGRDARVVRVRRAAALARRRRSRPRSASSSPASTRRCPRSSPRGRVVSGRSSRARSSRAPRRAECRGTPSPPAARRTGRDSSEPRRGRARRISAPSARRRTIASHATIG